MLYHRSNSSTHAWLSDWVFITVSKMLIKVITEFDFPSIFYLLPSDLLLLLITSQNLIWTNLPLRARFFGPARTSTQKSGCAKSKSIGMSNRETTRTFIYAFCNLHRTCSIRFYCNSIKSFCNEALQCKCCLNA